MNDTYIPTYYSTDVDTLSDQEITRYMGEIEASGVMCGHGEDLEREDYETGSWEDQAQNRWDALVREQNRRIWKKLSPDERAKKSESIRIITTEALLILSNAHVRMCERLTA